MDCKECEYQKGDLSKDEWKCIANFWKNFPTECYLKRLNIGVQNLMGILMQGSKVQTEYVKKVKKIIDKTEQDLDEGEEWKKK